MSSLLFKRITCLFLSVIMLCTHVLFAHALETNFWTERKKSVPSQIPQQSPQLSSAKAAVTERSAPTIFHIQDIHGNPAAQKSISKTISELIQQVPVDFVALEGAFEPLDFSAFVANTPLDHRKKIADYLLQKNKISGSVFSRMVAERTFPDLIGIDDAILHQRNVDAFLASRHAYGSALNQLNFQFSDLKQQKRFLNPTLAQFKTVYDQYHADEISFGAYVQALKQFSVARWPLGPHMTHFLEVRELETRLNKDQIERERILFIGSLAGKINSTELSALQYDQAHFLTDLTTLAEMKKISMEPFPALKNYLAFVSKSNEVSSEQVFAEVKAFEAALLKKIVRTKREQAIMIATQQWHLARKLIDFSLSKEEWTKYKEMRQFERSGKSGRSEINLKNKVSDFSDYFGPSYSRTSLQAFEQFYEVADERDQAMALKLSDLISQRKARFVIVVTGGYHTGGMNAFLRSRSMTVETLTPKLTQVDSASPSYLDSFSQRKEPIEKLFLGEKLFLADSPGSESVRRVLAPSLAAALAGMAKRFFASGGDPTFSVYARGNGTEATVGLTRQQQTVTIDVKDEAGHLAVYQQIMRGPSAWIYEWAHRRVEKYPSTFFHPQRMAGYIGFYEDVIERFIFQEGFLTVIYMAFNGWTLPPPSFFQSVGLLVGKVGVSFLWSWFFSSKLGHDGFFRGMSRTPAPMPEKLEELSIRWNLLKQNLKQGAWLTIPHMLMTIGYFVVYRAPSFSYESVWLTGIVLLVFYMPVGLLHGSRNRRARLSGGLLLMRNRLGELQIPTLTRYSFRQEDGAGASGWLGRQVRAGNAIAFSHRALLIKGPHSLFHYLNTNNARVLVRSLIALFTFERGEVAQVLGKISEILQFRLRKRSLLIQRLAESIQEVQEILEPLTDQLTVENLSREICRWVVIFDDEPHFETAEIEQFKNGKYFTIASGRAPYPMMPTIQISLSAMRAAVYDPPLFQQMVKRELMTLNLLKPEFSNVNLDQADAAKFEEIVKALQIIDTADYRSRNGDKQSAVRLLEDLETQYQSHPFLLASILRDRFFVGSKNREIDFPTQAAVLDRLGTVVMTLGQLKKDKKLEPGQERFYDVIRHFRTINQADYYRRLSHTQKDEAARKRSLQSVVELLTRQSGNRLVIKQELLVPGCNVDMLYWLAVDALQELDRRVGVFDLLTEGRFSTPLQLNKYAQRNPELISQLARTLMKDDRIGEAINLIADPENPSNVNRDQIDNPYAYSILAACYSDRNWNSLSINVLKNAIEHFGPDRNQVFRKQLRAIERTTAQAPHGMFLLSGWYKSGIRSRRDGKIPFMSPGDIARLSGFLEEVLVRFILVEGISFGLFLLFGAHITDLSPPVFFAGSGPYLGVKAVVSLVYSLVFASPYLHNKVFYGKSPERVKPTMRSRVTLFKLAFALGFLGLLPSLIPGFSPQTWPQLIISYVILYTILAALHAAYNNFARNRHGPLAFMNRSGDSVSDSVKGRDIVAVWPRLWNSETHALEWFAEFSTANSVTLFVSDEEKIQVEQFLANHTFAYPVSIQSRKQSWISNRQFNLNDMDENLPARLKGNKTNLALALEEGTGVTGEFVDIPLLFISRTLRAAAVTSLDLLKKKIAEQKAAALGA